MSQTVTVSIPHRLGKEEACKRIKDGIGKARADFASLMTVEEENWADNRVAFRVASLGQRCAGTIEVQDDHVKLEVTLPWLLAKAAEAVKGVVKQRGNLMLEKK
jgi:hypothetical protein